MRTPIEKEIHHYLCDLYRFSPRFWKNEKDTAEYIKKKIINKSCLSVSQIYTVTYPHWDTYYLMVDGEGIPVLPCCRVSGEITSGTVQSFSFDLDPQTPTLICNTRCPDVSIPALYDVPVLSVRPSDIPKIEWAKEVYGRVEVSQYTFQSENILVGNTKDPKKIFICHYDSYWGGAFDNGIGVATFLAYLDRINLSRDLVVFAGSEEMSMDDPYWCYGYRIFEEEYHSTLVVCDEIVVFDVFWYKKSSLVQDLDIVSQAFLIKDASLFSKTSIYCDSMDNILEIYQSPIDSPDKLVNLDIPMIESLLLL